MNNKTILIVEDNEINLKLARVLLKKQGYIVLTATNSEETFSILKDVHPDLILMDLQLPGIDGLHLTQLLKSDPKTKQIKIVALTAYALKSDREKADMVGCDGYITKPFDVNEFIKTIDSILNK